MNNEPLYHFVNNPFLFWPEWFNRLWARFMCNRGVHLFDDLLTDEPTNYCQCDACGFTVVLKETETAESIPIAKNTIRDYADLVTFEGHLEKLEREE